jgi:hypothetical protein
VEALDHLKLVFKALKSPEFISVQLLRKNRGGASEHYYVREIEIRPEESLTDFIQTISGNYEKELASAESIDAYTGDIVKGRIYSLPVSDPLIDQSFRELKNKTADPSKEGSILKGRWDGMLIMCGISVEGEKKRILLASMRSPISVLSNKYLFLEEDQFKKIKEPVLTLNKSLDAVIVGSTFYMLTMQAENLFDMERSYRKRCDEKVGEIRDMDILTDADAFEKTAAKGQNPRRFVSFSQSRLDAIKTGEGRRKYLRKFHIEMEHGRIKTDDPRNCERLIKFLCDKAMLDPVDNRPREVAAAREWS